jgi:hypothetical protein
MEKKFEELVLGDKFTVNNVEYVKTEEVRVSCCRSINCQVAADNNQKAFFPGSTVVVVNG